MQPQHNSTFRLVSALAIGVLFTGCHTKTAEAPAKKQEAATQKEEYVRTTSTGSWIPKKVKKTETPKADPAVTTVSPDAMDKLNESGRTQGTRGLGPNN